ncbi:MAG TPA: DUF86 domain-containing protein [Thermoanaerobaculia bacterium]|nr:DUF86 domain-containing protein [Thermoanaerobaculia bacterium]
MVRPDVVGRKLARASAWLDEAGDLIGRSEGWQTDAHARDLASFYLFLTIQECIDLAAHWVADAGWPVPDDAGAIFDLLADRLEIDSDLAERMRGAVGLRNRIAHGYSSLDHDRIRAEFSEGGATLRQFLAIVADAAGL